MIGFGALGLKVEDFFLFFFVAVVKEREMEIGYPTDVKHVSHIGWDGPSGTAPSWVSFPKLMSLFLCIVPL